MCKTRTAGSMSGSGVSVVDAPLWISVMQTWPVNSPADTNVCRRVNDEFHGMLIIFFFVSIWHPLSQSVWLAQSLWTTSLVTWTPGNPTSSVNIKEPVIFKQPLRTVSKGSWQVASDTCVALLPRVAVLHDAAEYEDDITPSITAKVGASVIWERSTLLRYVHFTQDRLSPQSRVVSSPFSSTVFCLRVKR